MINWVLLALDHKQVQGFHQQSYHLPTWGMTLVDHQVKALKAAKIEPNLIFDAGQNWHEGGQNSVFVLIDAAAYFFDSALISDLAECARNVQKEHVVYKVDGQSIALVVKAEHLNGVLPQVKGLQEPSNLRFVEACAKALIKAYDNHVEEILDQGQAVLVADLYDHHRVLEAVRRNKLMALMQSGVRILDSASVYVDVAVEIGPGTVIYPSSIIEGNTVIGKNCIIGPAARIVDSTIADGVTIKDSTVTSSKVDCDTAIGPYAYLRPKSDIGKNVKIGDFVEVKNARIDDGSKVSHLSYIGDGHIGKDVNIGCGVVFVNYDGKNKNKTVVEDGAFVGCNVNLVAPVTVHQGAYVAAGSTITEDVHPDSLAIARCKQTQKINWVLNKKK